MAKLTQLFPNNDSIDANASFRVGTAKSTRSFPNLRFRTRLALVMFLTMACTSAILVVTYINQNRRLKAYVSAVTSDLLAISQLTYQQIPADADANQALEAYKQALVNAGLSSVTVVSPTGEVKASSNPKQVGKMAKIKKRRIGAKQEHINILAQFKDVEVDTSTEQRTYSVEFPIVQGDEVIGYAQVRGVADEMVQLLRHNYLLRSLWILSALLAGMFAIVYLAFRFTKPIDLVVEGARQVAHGNLYVSLPATGSDEMGRLAQTFNQMVERLRENKKLQERLNEAEKMSLLGRFAGTVAHEVRNSLNFMNLSIDQVRAKTAGGDERAARDIQRNLSNVKEEINRLNRLVNDFLTAGRQSPPELGPCDLETMLEEAVALVDKQAQAQGVKINIQIAENLPPMQCDARQMKTCFLNILTNAVQAMPDGGDVRVTGVRAKSSQRLELRFADTGPGIPAQDREKIFAPYFSTKTTGFGLGLAITRKIVQDHGGRIYVAENGKPGTEMVVELPWPEPAAVPREVVATNPAA